MSAAICDPAKVMRSGIHGDGAGETAHIECAAPDEELLLVDRLNALVYEMATRRMLFSRFEIGIVNPVDVQGPLGGMLRLQATAWGEPLDVARHQPAAEVKGASFCELAVGQTKDGSWLAQCVVDV